MHEKEGDPHFKLDFCEKKRKTVQTVGQGSE
jgi:hypothetical protein